MGQLTRVRAHINRVAAGWSFLPVLALISGSTAGRRHCWVQQGESWGRAWGWTFSQQSVTEPMEGGRRALVGVGGKEVTGKET